MTAQIHVAGYEVPVTISSMAREVLVKLREQGVVIFTHDDGPSAEVRRELVSILRAINVTVIEDDYCVAIFDPYAEKKLTFKGNNEITALQKFMDEIYADPNSALAAAQGAVVRALETHKVTVNHSPETTAPCVVYTINGALSEGGINVACLYLKTKTLIWQRDGSTKEQDQLIKAHASLFAGVK